MNSILTNSVTLLVIILVGYITSRKGILTNGFSVPFSNLITEICCPLLIFSSICGTNFPNKTLILPLLGVSTLSYALIIIFAILITKLYNVDKTDQAIHAFAVTFGNVAFLGYPVCYAFYGQEAIFYAAILNLPNTVFVFTVGSSLIDTGKFSFSGFKWKSLFHPNCIATYLVILMVLFDLRNIPAVISVPCEMLGRITVPGALLLLGMTLSNIPTRSLFGNYKIYITSILRCIVTPLLIFAVFTLIPVDSLVRNINTILLAMPVATFGTVLCIQYGKSTNTIAATTFISTLLSLTLLPLWYFLFSSTN